MFIRNKIVAVIGIVFVVFLIFIAFSIFLLVKDDYKVMLYKDFVNFKSEEILKDNKQYLIVSGQYYGSSLRIKKVMEERKDGDIILRVYMSLFSDNNSAFLYPIELKDSVDRVLFSDEKKIIWERK